MAHPTEHYCGSGAQRVVLVLVFLILVVYIVGPKLQPKKNPSLLQVSCPCYCECFEDFAFPSQFEFVSGLYADCSKNDPEMDVEVKKDIVALLSEEVSLQKAVANDTLVHTNKLIRDAKTTSYQYRREAEKCSAQVETCEIAREKAEAELIEEVKLTKMWEKRAIEMGWNDNT